MSNPLLKHIETTDFDGRNQLKMGSNRKKYIYLGGASPIPVHGDHDHGVCSD